LNGTTGAVARPLSQILRLAVVTGISRAVQVHIDRGDDLNARDSKGQTPLMLAAARNKAAICKLLLGAGADVSLQDPAGKTAHDIAIAASAHDAASVIAASQIQLPEQAPAESGHAVETGSPSELPEQGSPDIKPEDEGSPTPSASTADSTEESRLNPDCLPSIPAEAPHGEELAADCAGASMTPAQVDDEQIPPALDQDDDLEFDLSGWVAEEESVAPAADPTIAVAAVALQAAISLHIPIDSADDWDDIDAFLPERATLCPEPLTRKPGRSCAITDCP